MVRPAAAWRRFACCPNGRRQRSSDFFSQTPADGNCGRCLKCILTALEFKCAGVEPECFATPISDAQIVETLSRYVTDPHGDICFREVLDAAVEGGLTGAWLPVLQRVLPR